MTEPNKTPSPADLPPPPGPNDYLIFLWNRRILIGALVFVCVVGTYIGIRLFHSESFETRAQIMVRSQPRLSVADRDIPGIRPPAFQTMFTSDETITFVRNQYNQIVESQTLFADPNVDGHQDHRRLTAPLEKLRPSFRAQAGTTVDTTIQREFSPVIELRARGTTRGQALAIMNLWINYIMDEFGNFMDEEAAAAVESARLRNEMLAEQLEPATRRRQELESRLLAAETQLSGILRQLTSAPRPELADPVSDRVLGWNFVPGARDPRTRIEQSAGAIEPGLLELRTRYELEIARIEGGGEPGELGSVPTLQARLSHIERMIPSLLEEAETLTADVAVLTGELAAARTETNRIEYAIRMTSSVASQAEAVMRPIAPDAEDHYRYGTLRLVGNPVVPNERVWPPRTVLSLLAGGGFLIFLLVVFCVERYMRWVIDCSWQKGRATQTASTS